MTMKRHSILILAVLMLASCGKPAVEPLSLRMVRSEMSRCPDATWLDFCEGKVSWNYTPGLEMKAFLDVYQTYGGEDIVSYVDDWYGKCIEEDGHITYYYKGDYTVDKVCPARTLYQLYDITGKERYRFAVDSMMTRLSQHPRTSEGAFWHKTVYPHQIWLDGLYMAEPFYAEYVSRYSQDKAEGWADIINDFTVAARHTYDPVTKLYRHAWDESRSMFWCDPETGQSQHCWGRALGWYCMALVDVLELIPEGAEGRGDLVEILRGIVDVLPSFADPQTGMWYQVLDCPGREGNYLEATCSAMFSYSLLKGVRLGYLDSSLEDYARKVYDGLVKTFITEDEDGLLSINQCCSVGGLGGKQMRMGDYAYYLSEPVRSNDPKGVGPFIWASLEMERR